MRPLVITDITRSEIKKQIEYAQQNMIALEDLKKISTGIIPPPGDLEAYAMQIPFGFRCVFTIEKQSIGECRHLSVSIESGKYNTWPSEAAVILIAKEFGFMGNILEDSHVYIEHESNAVNLIQPMTLH